MRNFFLFLFLSVVPLFASPSSFVRRIQAHLMIGDSSSAIDEAKKQLQASPESPLAYEMLIKCLAVGGDDAEMMIVWENFQIKFPENAFRRELLEEMCWGILRKGREAPSSASRLISIIGAALTQDMHAVAFLKEGMRDSNAFIRSISVQLSALYGDHPLKEEIIRLFYEEKSQEVRLEILKAIGELKITSLLPQLVKGIGNKRTSAEEKRAAIQAIVSFRESVGRDELELLIKSKRSGLRLLACECIAKCNQEEDRDLLFFLLHDSKAEVRAAALRAIGLLRQDLPLIRQELIQAASSLDPMVGITAGWVLLLFDQEKGEEALLYWLNDDRDEIRAWAASALSAAGAYGLPLAHKFLNQTEDPFVRANLALALLGQRQECVQACEILQKFLEEQNESWMLGEGLFSPILKNRLSHKPGIPNYPEVVNQTVRLKLLNLLAMMEHPGAYEAIKNFLKQKRWGVTGLAAETLLGEGDESAIELVRELLTDSDNEIKTEAALVLASWGKDHTALPVLLEIYPKADSNLKVKILESLGRIGDREAIPFLIERLKEPSLKFRMIAACVLIQTLNH